MKAMKLICRTGTVRLQQLLVQLQVPVKVGTGKRSGTNLFTDKEVPKVLRKSRGKMQIAICRFRHRWYRNRYYMNSYFSIFPKSSKFQRTVCTFFCLNTISLP
jgi:hypothetical protein